MIQIETSLHYQETYLKAMDKFRARKQGINWTRR